MVANETGSKRRRMIVLGSLLIAAGLIAAVATWLAAESRRSGAVENLARAPIGCDTTLDFAASGEYVLFVETTGRFDEVRGDCDAQGSYDVTTVRPTVEITVLDPDGEQLELEERRDDLTYSTGDFSGRSVFAIDVAEAGDHVMRVESEETATFAVAVGRDPNAGVGLLRAAGVLAGLTGLIVGLVLALFVGKSKQPTAAGWTPAQPGSGQWAPNQPPYAQPSHPPYAQPGTTTPPVYGGYGQPGQYGQPPGAGPGPRPMAPQGYPPHAAPPATTPASPQLPTAPTAPGSWAPQQSAPNPFAPPAGTRHETPAGSVAPIPGQPTRPPGAGTGDGALGWPSAEGAAPSSSSIDDDQPTPPRGVSASGRHEAPTSPPTHDKWDTSSVDPPA